MYPQTHPDLEDTDHTQPGAVVKYFTMSMHGTVLKSISYLM